MKFSREQFKEIPEFYIDDFPLEFTDDLRFLIINDMPRWLQGYVIAGDYEENIFEWLCKTQLNMTVKEYYDSDIAKEYFKNDKLIEYKCNNK